MAGGIAAIFHRDGSPVDPGPLDGMLDRLAHRGLDGCDAWLDGSVALGHQHFWTTPEETGERQPISLAGGSVHVVLDGRLDDRAELIARLGSRAHAGRAGTGPHLSDAELVGLAYRTWGVRCFEYLVGPFAVVIHDRDLPGLVCARDRLGDRGLHYALSDERVVIASEEWAVLGHPGVTSGIDSDSVLLYLSVLTPIEGSTFFSAVKEIRPGEVLTIDPGGVRSVRYPWLEAGARVHHRSDEQHGEHFRELLSKAIRGRLRGVHRPAVLMSGGLDSTSVAALAAHMHAEGEGGAPVRSITWTFDDLIACDERRWVRDVAERSGLEAVTFPAEEEWPLRAADTWPLGPSSPQSNPYQRLRDRAYRLAASGGERVLLTGDCGDHLYLDTDAWLADLVREARVGTAALELGRSVRELGLRRGLWREPALRQPLRRALERWPRAERWLAARRPAAAPHWLVPESARRVEEIARDPGYVASLPKHLESAARGLSAHVHHANRAGVELRHPYRDLRLVRLAACLPAHQRYRGGRYKAVARRAMGDTLPPSVLQRREPSSLTPFYRQALLEREGATVRRWLASGDAPWRQHVRPEALSEILDGMGRGQPDGPASLLPWSCIMYDLWRRRLP